MSDQISPPQAAQPEAHVAALVTERPSRANNAERVAQLRAEGLTQKEIGQQLGLSRSYVAELIADPEGIAVRQRKASYSGTCETCGAETKSDGTSRASRQCDPCSREARVIWTPEAVIDAINRFAAEHGRPPLVTDWTHADPEKGFPNATSIYGPAAAFPNWADAVEAAGFPRPRQGLRPMLTVACQDCGEDFESRGPGAIRCERCKREHHREYHRLYARRPERRAKQQAGYRLRSRSVAAIRAIADFPVDPDTDPAQAFAEVRRIAREALNGAGS